METKTHAPVRGLVLRGHAWYYDWVVRLMAFKAGRSHVGALLQVAQVRPGDAVLDIGCGTGTLALACARQAGAGAPVFGIDASQQMIARARRKARGTHVEFVVGTVEALPFDNARFDLVLSTLMLHHLPRPAREACAREARRVLRPGGRFVACDFQTPEHEAAGLIAKLHRHGGVPLAQVGEIVRAAGFRVEDSGLLGVSDLHYTVAQVPM
jgi:ubiquinone/menaquinone biosynthesis C-methylase UbiE